MCNAKPCRERRAAAAALAQQAQVQIQKTAKPKVSVNKTVVKSPTTHVVKRGR